jgi:hypothetical protein
MKPYLRRRVAGGLADRPSLSILARVVDVLPLGSGPGADERCAQNYQLFGGISESPESGDPRVSGNEPSGATTWHGSLRAPAGDGR